MVGWLHAAGREIRASAQQATTFLTVGLQTGMLSEMRPAAVLDLLRDKLRLSPSAVVRASAKNNPDRAALIHGDRSYSYAEFDHQCDLVAAALRAHGLGAGDTVAVMLKNVPEYLFLQTAAGRIGAATANMSWRSTGTELSYLLAASGAKALFFCPEAANAVNSTLRHGSKQVDQLLSARAFVVGESLSAFGSFEDFLASRSSGAYGAGVEPDRADEAAVIIYTSGTTGKPKGAVRRFPRNMMVTTLNFIAELGMRVGQIHLAVCPLYHSTAFAFVNMCFGLGSTVVLAEQFEPQSFLAALERYQVNHTAVVPTMLHRVLELGPEAIGGYDSSALEAIISGGAPLSGPLAARVMDAFGDKLFNFYGSTETGTVTVANPTDLRAAPGTIGRVIVGNEIKIIAEGDRLCRDGEIGELFVRSGGLIEGYHNELAASGSSLQEEFFSVGDLVRQDERGYLFLAGRKRDMIISGGVNVYPAEVENVLLSHPAVAAAVVVGGPDEQWGERVVAFVRLDPGARCESAELITFCRNHLAGPKRPQQVQIVSQFPHTSTGKVLRRQLRESLFEPNRSLNGGDERS